MGQDVVARDEVELHSSRVVLECQQALPHDGVLLLTGEQSRSALRAGGPAVPATALAALAGLSLGDLRTFSAAQSLERGRPSALTFRSWTMSTGLWEVKCGEESCLEAGWASVCGRVSPGGVLGPEVVGTNKGCFGAA